MPYIRVFVSPRRSLQRVGFLKYLLWRASLSTTNNISTLGRDLIAAVSQKVSVALTPELREYIRNALTTPLYSGLKSAVLMTGTDSTANAKIQVEVQDLCLSSPTLPSKRGRLVNDDWNRYPQLAIDLGLLRRGTYSLFVRGQAFLTLVPERENKTFGISKIAPFDDASNPLRLTIQQKLLLLFSFIEGDGDVLMRLYDRLLKGPDVIAAQDAGNYLPEIYRTIAAQMRPKARSGDDFSRLQRLLDTADKIEAVKRNSSPGGKNAREHGITVRLEPFVDLGLLSKPDSLGYRFQITEPVRMFFQPFIDSGDTDHFLRCSFFDVSNKALGLNGKHRADHQAIISPLQKAYAVLKSPLGYAPILEVALLAGIYSITENSTYFEVCESIDTIRAVQKEKPDLVGLSADRGGNLAFVKFNDDLKRALEL